MGRTSQAPLQLQEALLTLVWEQCYGSVTVDAICTRAKVTKGSFYHFYKSKAELALAAFESHWDSTSRPRWDALFSASEPPVTRIQNWLGWVYQKAQEQQKAHQRVLGCPFFNIAQETSAIEPEVSLKISELLARFLPYLTAALRDAHEQHLADCPHPEAVARLIFTQVQGSVAQARIQNSPLPLAELPQAVSRLSSLEIEPFPNSLITAS